MWLRTVGTTKKSIATIRGTPQRGLADDTRRMRSRTSLATVGRPALPARVGLVQCSRNLRRRQAITVLGCTMNNALRHPDQILESQAMRMRSVGRTRRRFTDRWQTPSWCRRARISIGMEARVRERSKRRRVEHG
jgi:hypothetical protein